MEIPEIGIKQINVPEVYMALERLECISQEYLYQVFQSKASLFFNISTSEKHLEQDKLVITENSG